MGRFQPGQEKPEGSGRKRGSPNKRSAHLHEVLDSIGLNAPQRLLELLPQLSLEKQADVLLNLMSYLYPKKKAIEIASPQSEEARKIEVVFVNSGSPNTNAS